jgi:hypothetical protein
MLPQGRRLKPRAPTVKTINDLVSGYYAEKAAKVLQQVQDAVSRPFQMERDRQTIPMVSRRCALPLDSRQSAQPRYVEVRWGPARF